MSAGEDRISEQENACALCERKLPPRNRLVPGLRYRKSAVPGLHIDGNRVNQDLRSLLGVIGLSKEAYTRFYGSLSHDRAAVFVRHRSCVVERRRNGRDRYTEPGNFAPF